MNAVCSVKGMSALHIKQQIKVFRWCWTEPAGTAPGQGCSGSCWSPRSPGTPRVSQPQLLWVLCCSGEGNKWLQLTSLFMPGQLLWSLASSGVEPILCPFSANSFTGGSIWEAELGWICCWIQARAGIRQWRRNSAWLEKEIISRVAERRGHVTAVWIAVHISTESQSSVRWDNNVVMLFWGWLGENLNSSPDIVTCASMWVIQTSGGDFIHSAFP